MFSPDKSKGLFCLKLKGPPVNINKWNFLGGKIEENETEKQAVVREIKEESGITTLEHNWVKFCELGNFSERCKFDQKWSVAFYSFFTDKIFDFSQKEIEPVQIFDLNNLPENIAGNLHWLISMALNKDKDYCLYYNISEIN